MERIDYMIEGEIACVAGVVSVAECIPFENKRMASRRMRLPFEPTFALVTAFPYYVKPDPNAKPPMPERRPRKILPLYARGKDYVNCNRKRLGKVCEILKEQLPHYNYRPTGNGWPLPIVQAARLAGLGNIGVHGLLIVPEYGSTVTLGAILTDMPLTRLREPGGYCEQCGLCAAACPTKALHLKKGKRRLDKTRCLSHISELKNLTPEQRTLLTDSPYAMGCDICQNACPHNKNPKETTLPEYREDLLETLNAKEAFDMQSDRKYYPLRNLCARNIELGFVPRGVSDS